MLVDQDLVRKVARLAQLELSPQEVEYYETQMGRILKYVETLNSLEDGLETTWRADLEGAPTAERPDAAKEGEAAFLDAVMDAAPQVAGTSFQVPRIID